MQYNRDHLVENCNSFCVPIANQLTKRQKKLLQEAEETPLVTKAQFVCVRVHYSDWVYELTREEIPIQQIEN